MRDKKFKIFVNNKMIHSNIYYYAYIDRSGILNAMGGISLEYIGMTDGKNVEICEGDIVKTNLDGIDYIGEIVYKAPSFCLKIREENGECAHSYLEQWHDGVRIEVLGNVYENAEILNQKHI